MELVLSLLTTLLLMTASCSGCKVDQCTRSYNTALDEEELMGPVASPVYCQILHAYGTCLKETARKCRGNLSYHTVTSVLKPLAQRNNCSGQSKPLPRPALKPATEPPPPPPPVAACTFNGRHLFRHCGLFGDPHLKTFNNEYQTCRVQGAWPLIDNPYLAVQVTNEPVTEGSPATATTKVTVLIKGRSTPCSTQKMYEATADVPLPATFIDGTYRSDHIKIATSAETQPERVEIFIAYIETTLVIRRVGKYLAFSARLPEDLVEASIADDDNLQLCSRGCPPSEKLDLVTSRGHAVSWETALNKCRQTDQLSNEILNNLTDYYIDWCVFDAMTAGDGHGFTAAAHSAQADVLRLDPGSLHNRTAPLELHQLPVYSSSSTNSISLPTYYSFNFTVLLLTFIVVNRLLST